MKTAQAESDAVDTAKLGAKSPPISLDPMSTSVAMAAYPFSLDACRLRLRPVTGDADS